ncbi:MAG TPA: S8 family serine peptidase [Mycobacteriales bacterium]|nr:S8 family serine peptidase [Mycobacteriales bacterium]
MRRSSLAVAAVGAVVLSFSVGPGPASAAPGPAAAAGAAAAPSAAAKIPSLVRQQAAKIRTELGRTTTLSPKARTALGDDLVGVDAAGSLDLQLHAGTQVGKAQLAQLTALGATVRSSSADFAAVPGVALPQAGLVHASVPVGALDAVAALPWVAAVRPAIKPATDVGPVTSEGVALHRADKAQRLGITGRGQRVGAMSDGVTSLAESVAKGELPADVQVLDPGDGDEGTGMLEIVHDEAPGAKLLFSGTGETLEDHVAGLRALAAAGAGLITEDLAFDDEPAFQQGLAASTAEALARSGVFFSSSAGNLGARHTPRVAAVGTGRTPDDVSDATFGTACGPVPHNTVAVAGGTDNAFDLRLGQDGLILATLQWSEPRAIFPTVGQGGFTDVNLYLLDQTGRCLAVSNATQANGVGDTIEQVLYDSAELGAGTHSLKLVVDVAGTSSAVAPPTIDLRWRTAIAGSAATDAPSRAGSLNPDSNYLGAATSAGAADAGLSTDPKAVPLETFSAGGPVQVGSTTTCPRGKAGPCTGVAGPRFRTAIAPTWTAADGVSVSGSGGFPDPDVCPSDVTGVCQFFGTSAAAPSATGVAALVRQSLGGRLSPPLLNLALKALAVDRGAPGRDNEWGAGVLRALPI